VIKKTLATAAVAASVVGAGAMAATPAMAVGDDELGPTSVAGDGSTQLYGNTTTGGYMSPNVALINGSLNKPCLTVPIPIVEDVLGSTNPLACTEGSTSVDSADPLSNLLSEVPLLNEGPAVLPELTSDGVSSD
jgi:hypothetical protein